MKKNFLYKRLTTIILIVTLLLSTFFLFSCSNKDINLSPPTLDENNQTSQDKNEGYIEEISPKNLAMYVKSKVDGLNIRNDAKTSSQVIGQINKNDMVVFIKQVGNYYQTYYKGKFAYISSSKTYTEVLEIEKLDNKTEEIINVASKYLGTKYVYGATRLHNGKGKFLTGFTTSEFDCSSFVQYAYFYGGQINLGLTSREQALQGKNITGVANIKRGDLMFFTNANRLNNSGIEKIGHVGIFLGDNYILHTAYDYAVIEPISNVRWSYLIYIRRHVNV